MAASENTEGRNRFQFRIRASRLISSRRSEWKWRLAVVVLVFVYLVQDAIDLRWEWLYQLKAVDGFKYATGTCLILYVGWQWYLFLARLKRWKVGRLIALHQRSGESRWNQDSQQILHSLLGDYPRDAGRADGHPGPLSRLYRALLQTGEYEDEPESGRMNVAAGDLLAAQRFSPCPKSGDVAGGDVAQD